MKKLSNTEAGLKKSVGYRKKACRSSHHWSLYLKSIKILKIIYFEEHQQTTATLNKKYLLIYFICFFLLGKKKGESQVNKGDSMFIKFLLETYCFLSFSCFSVLTLHKRIKFSIKDLWLNLQFLEDLLTFTEEILNGKFHILCSVT